MRRNNQTCVLFEDVPPDTDYRKGHYSWVSNSTADKYIQEGYCKEYNPFEAKPEKHEPDPECDLPKNLPGRNHFKEAGKDWKAVQKLHEKGKLKKVAGIGDSTEHKINEYMEAINGDS